jgi:uncharacterized membrane protein YhhN
VKTVLITAFFAAIAAFFAAEPLGFPGARLGLKPLPVLILALATFALRPASTLARAIMAGLLLSSVGDVLLEMGTFIPGLAAFLAAHLAYVFGFWSDERRPAWARLVPFLAWGAFVLALHWPGLGDVAGPVIFYVGAIVGMMWRAAARVRTWPSSTAFGLLGALAFGLSDTLVAWVRFKEPLPWAGVPLMLLYWAGQAGIFLSVPRKEPS